MTPEQALNKQLENYLKDIPTPDRVACYVRDNKLEVCLGGPHIFWYFPETNLIRIKRQYSCLKPFNGRLINKETLKQIYDKITLTPGLVSLDKQLKEKYRIQKKSRLNKDQLTLISKYEESMRSSHK